MEHGGDRTKSGTTWKFSNANVVCSRMATATHLARKPSAGRCRAGEELTRRLGPHRPLLLLLCLPSVSGAVSRPFLSLLCLQIGNEFLKVLALMQGIQVGVLFHVLYVAVPGSGGFLEPFHGPVSFGDGALGRCLGFVR